MKLSKLLDAYTSCVSSLAHLLGQMLSSPIWLTLMQRVWLRQTLTLDRKVHWPRENVARAKYYLSQVLLLKEGEDTKEEGAALQREARSLLEELLTPVRGEDAVARQLESDKSGSTEGTLFDYLAPWGYRVVVPQADGIMSSRTPTV